VSICVLLLERKSERERERERESERVRERQRERESARASEPGGEGEGGGGGGGRYIAISLFMPRTIHHRKLMIGNCVCICVCHKRTHTHKHTHIHIQRTLMLKQLGLSDCSVEGAMMGQLRLLLACYAVTFCALAAGAHRTENIGAKLTDTSVFGGGGLAEAEGRGQRGSMGKGNAGKSHWRGPRGGLKRELERKRQLRVKSQTEYLLCHPRGPD
jgi:hypothetical protein